MCNLLLDPNLFRKIFSKVIKAKDQKVARSKGQNFKNFFTDNFWVKTKALHIVLHSFPSFIEILRSSSQCNLIVYKVIFLDEHKIEQEVGGGLLCKDPL